MLLPFAKPASLLLAMLMTLTSCAPRPAGSSSSRGPEELTPPSVSQGNDSSDPLEELTPPSVSQGSGSQGDASAPEDTGSASVQEAGGDAANSASTSGSSGEICAYPPAQETDVSQKEEPTVTAPEPDAVPEPEPHPEPEPEAEPVVPTADAARAYIGQSASNLIAALGSPISSSYAPSCLGPGEDGELIYSGFTVYTYRENGVETVEDVL